VLNAPDILKRLCSNASSEPVPLGFCFVLFASLLLSRDPAILFHAQFWGEDGWFWYPQAHHDGLLTLFRPENGYLQTVSRLVALVALPLPLAASPTVYAGFAFVAQLLVPLTLASDRLAQHVPDRLVRLVLACLLVVMPDQTEVYANLTNTQWHLAALAFLILLADAPRSRSLAVFDGSFLLLSALSGPFSLLLLPVAAVELCVRRTRTSLIRVGFVAFGAAVQGLCILLTMTATRSPQPLGASFHLFSQIISGQIVLVSLLGRSTLGHVEASGLWKSGILPACLCLLGFIVLLEALRLGNRFVRQACLFGALVLAAALTHPQATMTGDQWPVLTIPDSGTRYFFIPVMVWLGLCLFVAGSAHAVSRKVAQACLLSTLLIAVPRDWQRPDEPDRGFYALAKRFDSSPHGTVMSLPIRPGTQMTAQK